MIIPIVPTISEPFILPETGRFVEFTVETIAASATTNTLESPTTSTFITDLHEEGYAVLQPIPVEIERVGDADFLASFKEANIAIGGADNQDAFQSLVAEILDSFDSLTTEDGNLGSDAAAQLAVLRNYIVRA